eukprot:171541-Prorocentrum_minimum.AAC.1
MAATIGIMVVTIMSKFSPKALLIGSPLEDAAESLLNNWAVSHTKRGISEAKEIARAKDPEQVAMVLRAVLVEEVVGEVPACLPAVLGLEREGVL